MNGPLRDTIPEQLGRIIGELGALHTKVDSLVADRERLNRTVRRVRSLETETQRLSRAAEGPDWKPDPREITGTFELQRLNEERRERHSEAKWGRRQRAQWIGALAIALVAALIGGITARFAAPSQPAPHGQHP